MDWFSWLSKTGLDPSLIYDYGLIFTHNELEEDDTAYFTHEFLQSMGISIAKHRLEILKLARKDRAKNLRSRLVIAIKRTKRSLAKYIQTIVHRDRDNSALALVPKRSYSARWKGAMMKRNSKRLVVPSNNSQGNRLLLTNGSGTPMVLSGSGLNSFSSPLMVRGYYEEEEEEEKAEEGEGDPYWSAGVEEIRWDAMFQDLKPT